MLNAQDQGCFHRRLHTRCRGNLCLHCSEILSREPASNVRNDALFVIVGTATAPYCTHIWNRSEPAGARARERGNNFNVQAISAGSAGSSGPRARVSQSGDSTPGL